MRRKLTIPVLLELIGALQEGNYVVTACKYVGIGTSTFSDWNLRASREIERVDSLEEDAEGIVSAAAVNAIEAAMSDPDKRSATEIMAYSVPAPFVAEEWIFVVFAHHVERARSVAEMRALRQVQAASYESWQAAAWYLERSFPDRYGKRQRLNIEGAGDGSPVGLEMVSVDELERKLQSLLEHEEGSA